VNRALLAPLRNALLACAVFSAAANAHAGEPLQVSDAWVSPTVPGQSVAAAYMKLRSARDAILIAIESDVSSVAAIHRMTMVGDVMRMRQAAQVELSAGQSVLLAPGGLHVMLAGLRQPLAIGDRVQLTLTLRYQDGRIERQAVVASVARRASHAHAQ